VKFDDIEEPLYQWINVMRCATLTLPQSLAIAKAQEINRQYLGLQQQGI
jgi:hypothetical protein